MTAVNGIVSGPRTVKVGVPQGSILGPLFFILYINNITTKINLSEICLFADDSVLYYVHKDIAYATKIMQQDLLNLHNWMDANKLTINTKKTQYMIISGHHKKYENIRIKIKNSQLTRTRAYKYLGVKIDQHLNYSQHINNLAGIVKNKLRTLTRLSYFLPKGIFIMLYKALIVPHFDYASSIWGSANGSLLNDLQDIQTRGLTRLLKHTNIEENDLHYIAKTQTLEQRRNKQLLLIIYNVYILKQECYLLEEPKSFNHGHNTRNNKALHIPKPNTNYLKKTVTYHGIQFSPSTIPLIQKFDSKSTLKNSYRRYCLDQ